MEFSGAKLALFLGSDLLVIRRDDKPEIPFPDHWDLPGGGREGGETPQECALRETHEEVGLSLGHEELIWSSQRELSDGTGWFFVAFRPASDQDRIRFGNEGQGWRLMDPRAYCTDPLRIVHLAEQLGVYLETR